MITTPKRLGLMFLVAVVAPRMYLPAACASEMREAVSSSATNQIGGQFPANSAAESREIKKLVAVLEAASSHGEKAAAVEALARLGSQSAAASLVDHLTSVKSFVRLGLQLTPVIGPYPCAFALLKIGTNSIPPLLVRITSTDDKEVSNVSVEIMRLTLGGEAADKLLQSRLDEVADGAERSRIQAALTFLRKNNARANAEIDPEPPR